ncbi:MAG: class I SAM-dependent methyltransferase [Phycisphaerales bacterium]
MKSPSSIPHPSHHPGAPGPPHPPGLLRPSITPAELSATAATLYQSGPRLLRLMQRYRPFISPFELLLPHVPTGATLLDVGCGGGLLLSLLAARQQLTLGVGFDSSSRAIAAAEGARRALADRGSVLHFERLDASRPWPSDPVQFDVVSIIDVIHHVAPAHQRGVIETACARVKPGGILLYKDMCRRPRWRAATNRLHDLIMARQWIHPAPIEQVELWAAGCGLTVEHRASITRYWYGHELRVFRRPSA